MNVSVVSLPVPMRNSLILTGAVLRTHSVIDADCGAPFAVHVAVPNRSPLKLAGPDVTLNVTLALSPGAIGPGIVSEPPPSTAALQPAGSERPSFTLLAGAPLLLVKVTIVSWLVPGANVCRPGGPP